MKWRKCLKVSVVVIIIRLLLTHIIITFCGDNCKCFFLSYRRSKILRKLAELKKIKKSKS